MYAYFIYLGMGLMGGTYPRHGYFIDATLPKSLSPYNRCECHTFIQRSRFFFLFFSFKLSSICAVLACKVTVIPYLLLLQLIAELLSPFLSDKTTRETITFCNLLGASLPRAVKGKPRKQRGKNPQSCQNTNSCMHELPMTTSRPFG